MNAEALKRYFKVDKIQYAHILLVIFIVIIIIIIILPLKQALMCVSLIASTIIIASVIYRIIGKMGKTDSPIDDDNVFDDEIIPIDMVAVDDFTNKEKVDKNDGIDESDWLSDEFGGCMENNTNLTKRKLYKKKCNIPEDCAQILRRDHMTYEDPIDHYERRGFDYSKAKTHIIPDIKYDFTGDDLNILQAIRRGNRTERAINGRITADKYYFEKFYGEDLDNNENREWWGRDEHLDFSQYLDKYKVSYPDEKVKNIKEVTFGNRYNFM